MAALRPITTALVVVVDTKVGVGGVDTVVVGVGAGPGMVVVGVQLAGGRGMVVVDTMVVVVVMAVVVAMAMVVTDTMTAGILTGIPRIAGAATSLEGEADSQSKSGLHGVHVVNPVTDGHRVLSLSCRVLVMMRMMYSVYLQRTHHMMSVASVLNL
jgi:hypothetical protein